MALVKVSDVNKALAAKGLHITIPLGDDVIISGMDILEKVKEPGSIKVLMRVKYLDEKGREAQEVFVCEGSTDIQKKATARVYELPKKALLPKRDHITFDNDDEALDYIKQAVTSLLNDKGYELKPRPGSDLYFEREGKGFFVNLAVRLDDTAFEKAKALVEIRRSLREKGGQSDYGLVVPSIQESLGTPLRVQERWVSRNQDYLSVQRVGVYGVDNQDPNTLYPFTIYPMSLELKRYFMVTSQQWSLVRSRYVMERAKTERGQSPIASFATLAGGGMGMPAGAAPGAVPPPPPPPPPPPMPGM